MMQKTEKALHKIFTGQKANDNEQSWRNNKSTTPRRLTVMALTLAEKMQVAEAETTSILKRRPSAPQDQTAESKTDEAVMARILTEKVSMPPGA